MKFYWTYNQKIRARRPYFQELAKQMGLGFMEKDTDKISTYLRDISIFKRGKPDRRVNNIILKESELPLENIYFFDYHYVVSTGNSTAIFDQTIFFVQTKHLSLPEFELKPKSPFNKVADYFGKKRPSLNHPYLSKNYLLDTDSPKVLDWITQDSFIEILKQHPKLKIHGANYQLVMFRHKKLAPKDSLKKIYNDYLLIYDFLKNSDQGL